MKNKTTNICLQFIKHYKGTVTSGRLYIILYKDLSYKEKQKAPPYCCEEVN